MIAIRLALFILGLALPFVVDAAATGAAPAKPPVVISGTVPDEATKASLLERLRAIYGTANVLDELVVGAVIAPPGWSGGMLKLLSRRLSAISKGQIVAQGRQVTVHGEVASVALHQAIAGEFAGSLGANYVLHDDLRVTATSQDALDRALAGSAIEFEPGSALLTDEGKQTLDGILATLRSVDPTKIEVIGHTDNVGDAAKNMALSQARADSIKVYLVAHGMAAGRIRTSGMGEDQPIMPNTTEEGRRRNRRIEFRIGE